MRILIIGGTGNISSEVARILHDTKHSITVVTRGSRPVPPGYDRIVADRTSPDNFAARLVAQQPDVVIDFLAFTPDHCQLDYELFRGRIRQFIFISSATVYEKPHRSLPITETTPRGNPFSEYAQRKIACEDYLEAVHGPDFPVTIVRPSHTFGNTWIPSPISGSDFTVAARILAGKEIVVHDKGESLWTLTAASDFAAGFAGLVGNDAALGETFHITSDEPLRWNDIYTEIGTALGRAPRIVRIPSAFISEKWPDGRAKLQGDKAEDGVFDNSKIKRFAPAFRCSKPFGLAIRESIAWYNEDSSRKTVNCGQDQLLDNLIEAWQAQTIGACQST